MSNNLEQILRQCINLSNPINIIIANGEPPKDQYLLSLFGKANCIICCDGAINTLERSKIEPDYIVGDCDSLSKMQQQKYADKIKYFPDQNLNDLTKAVDFAHNGLHLDDIVILGATGLREDHSLANIALLVEYAKNIKNITIISDYGFFRVYSGKVKIATVPNQQISLFTVYSNTQVTTHGLKWDLNNLTLDSWYKGTLNEATQSAFELDSTLPILVYQSFELKLAGVEIKDIKEFEHTICSSVILT